MTAREAKRRAYGIAAHALHKAIETELVGDDELNDDDQGRMFMACKDLTMSLARRATKDWRERADFR